MKKILFIYLIAVCTLSVSQAQDLESEDEFSLEDLMNATVSVASSKETTIRESPGIVTIITENEIKTSGARDLVDIIRIIPGLEIVGELDNTITIGVRGNFAEEGKALFMIDGLEMNEIGYGTFMIGGRVLPEQIERIEVIRGPGSAIYGGMAELAVINIITKKGAALNGGYGAIQSGVSNGGMSRYNVQFGFGDKVNDDLEYSINTYYGQSNRSNNTNYYATNPYGVNGEPVNFNFQDSSIVKTFGIEGNIKYKELIVNSLYQDYLIDNYGYNGKWFQEGGLYLSAKYGWKVSDKFTLTPEVSWKKEHPWVYKKNVSQYAYNTWAADAYRIKGKLTAQLNFNENWDFTFGGEFREDKLVKPKDADPFLNNTNKASYTNAAGFAELNGSGNWGNLTVGSRFDYHSKFGRAFVPRIAYTKAWDKIHIKGLISRAFKGPVVYNFELNPNIKAEYTTTAEIEAGVIINKMLSLTTNVFYINIDAPIVYEYNSETDVEFYINGGNASTIGIEFEAKLKSDWGYLNTSYSYYQNNNTNVLAYEVENNNKLLRGLPAHKIVVNSGINIGSKWVLSPTVIYNTNKVGYFAQQEYYEGVDYYNYGSTFILNLNIIYQLNYKLDLNLSGYDLLGQNFIAANAYDILNPGIPTMGREFALKLRYKF